MNILKGKSAIVTGAASGIGRATAMLFAAEGASVLVLDRSPEVQQTAAEIQTAGGRAVAMTKDSSLEANVAEAVACAVEEFGRLDVCYANAGISGGLVPFFEETAVRFNEILQINLIGTFLLAQYAARQMVKQKHGSIICTASVAGLRSGAGGVNGAGGAGGVSGGGGGGGGGFEGGKGAGLFNTGCSGVGGGSDFAGGSRRPASKRSGRPPR